MKRRTLLAAGAALPLLAALPAQAAPLPLSQLSAYLNGLTSVQARFVQVNADGSQDKGLLSIRRPGRARFEYDPPNRAVVIVGGGQVSVFDNYRSALPEVYPLKRTPLNLILGADIDLGTARMVVGHRSSGDRTLVIAQDPQNPDYGQIGLYFEEKPVRLAEWIITNEAGEQTRVVLGDFATRDALPARLFSADDEEQKRGR